jgi:hypothetical protein
LRFRPLATADQEAHTLQIGLLMRDLADADPDILYLAAEEWSREQRFMPKAVELLDLMHKLAAPQRKDLQREAERATDLTRIKTGRTDIHWVVRDGRVVCEWAVPPSANL